MGEMQNITRKICGEIRDGRVALPHQGLRSSNTVFTAAIVEAVVQISRTQGTRPQIMQTPGAQTTPKPGTYDLITFPQWTWLDVYKYYAAQLGLPLQLARPEEVRDAQPGLSAPGASLRRLLHYLANHRTLAERLTFFLALLPRSVNERIYLRYLQTRARSEINALRASEKVEICVQDWRELRVNSFAQMADPVTLMARYPLRVTAEFAGSNEAAG